MWPNQNWSNLVRYGHVFTLICSTFSLGLREGLSWYDFFKYYQSRFLTFIRLKSWKIIKHVSHCPMPCRPSHHQAPFYGYKLMFSVTQKSVFFNSLPICTISLKMISNILLIQYVLFKCFASKLQDIRSRVFLSFTLMHFLHSLWYKC